MHYAWFVVCGMISWRLVRVMVGPWSKWPVRICRRWRRLYDLNQKLGYWMSSRIALTCCRFVPCGGSDFPFLSKSGHLLWFVLVPGQPMIPTSDDSVSWHPSDVTVLWTAAHRNSTHIRYLWMKRHSYTIGLVRFRLSIRPRQFIQLRAVADLIKTTVFGGS